MSCPDFPRIANLAAMNDAARLDAALVSVIVPAWNCEAWISDAIRSAVSQTWERIEVIVIDDGSTDRTGELARDWPDSRVMCLRQEHQGAAAARNRGLRQANGDFIQFLDADDVLAADKLALQLAALGENPPDSVASCSWARFASGSQPAPFDDEPVWPVEDPVEWLIRSLSGEGMMQPAGWLVPQSITNTCGPWNESLTLHDDGDYFARVLVKAARNVFVRGAAIFYRDVAGSLSKRRSRAAIESAFSVCNARRDTLLSIRNDLPARRALATQYAQFAYEFDDAAPDLTKRALEAIRLLAASPVNVIGGSAFRAMSKAFGFGVALRLRSAAKRGN